MAAAAGSLVVSLGLDAAEYTRGLTKAERDAYAFGEAIGSGIRTAALTAATALASLGVSAAGAVAGFNSLIEGAAKFSDLADKTGASAESLASFAVAAGTSGTSLDKIAGGMNTLTKNLVGVSDESKQAGAALKALGIPLQDFKALKPDEQFEKLSKTLAGFKDGADKSAVAMALLGRSGAELLAFMKTLDEQGGRQKILLQSQIDLSDEYADRQAKARAELEIYAQALATQAIPALTAFTGAMTDTIKEVLGVDQSTKELKNSTAIADFADASVRALAFVVDAADGVARAFQIAGTAIGASAAAVVSVVQGEFSAAKAIATAGLADVDAILQRETFSSKLDKRLQEARTAAAKLSAPDTRPDLKFNGRTRSSRGGRDSAAQEAKAQLGLDLDAIKAASGAIINTYSNQEKVLEALRSAGLRDEETYYVEKQRLLALSVSAQEDALQKQIARLQQESLSGKAQIENVRKIANVEAELAKLRADAATNTEVLSIKQTDALEKIAAKFEAARQAAQGYVDAISNQNTRALDGMGRGNNQRDRDTRLAGREDDFENQRRRLVGQLTAGEITRQDYDKYLAIQQSAHAAALQSDADYWTKKTELQGSFTLGAKEALTNYFEDTQNIYDQIGQVGTNAFKGLEDALVDFTKTGRLNFKSLADSILADMARVAIKQSITGPLAGWLSGAMGASGGGFDWASLFGGKRASGGNVSAGKFFEVNERGPELLDVGGRKLLMMGNQSGRITPNHQLGSDYSRMPAPVINIAVEGQVDRRTASQVAAQAGAATTRAMRRHG